MLSFELSSIPYSLTNSSLKKVVKNTLCSLLEKDVHTVQQLTASTNPEGVIINGMAVLQKTKSSAPALFWLSVSPPCLYQYSATSLKEVSINEGEHSFTSRC